MTAQPYDREAGGGALGESEAQLGSGVAQTGSARLAGVAEVAGSIPVPGVGPGSWPTASDSPSAPANPLLDQALADVERTWPGSTRVLRKGDEQQMRDELAAADQHDLQREYK